MVVNDNATKEIISMLSLLNYIQEVVVWYMAHPLCAKVQSTAIAKIKAELKVNRKVLLIVKDHKQKVLPMNF